MPSRLFPSHPEPFRDRTDAGDRLAEALRPRLEGIPPAEIVVAGLVRGGVIVAAEVARRLGARLDAIVVRKLGAPDQPELAIGAIAADGSRVLNTPLIDNLGLSNVDVETIADRATHAARVLCTDLGVEPDLPGIAGTTVILVDDGMATGATMRVAIESVRRHDPARLIVALPVAPATAEAELKEIVDDAVVVLAPPRLQAVGQWYRSFLDVPTSQVREALDPHSGPLPG